MVGESGVIHFFSQIISDWNEFIKWEEPEIVAQTTFWIV